MENLSYSSSYPDSGDSSPGSRDVDIEESQGVPQATSSCPKVKFLCSYGGKIQPRPHDNQLSYIGGDTKILALDPNTAKFGFIISRLASLCGDPDVSSFKYQLPGEDLDALVSVINDEDLDHMMIEYDRLHKASSKPARLRLFIFPSKPRPNRDQEWFVDALNSPLPPPPPPPSSSSDPPANPDFLFGLEKEEEDHPQVNNNNPEEANPNINPCYNPEKVEEIPVQLPIQAPYFPERHVAEPVYFIPATTANTAGIYQARGVPVTGQISHPGYYAVYNPVPVKMGGGYVQLGFDAAGRHVYCAAPATPYHAVAPAAVMDGAAPTQSSPM